MIAPLIKLRNKIVRFIYKYFLKPIFFLMDPEFVHDQITKLGSILGKSEITRNITWKIFYFEDKSLEQKILGIKFINPIGLSAGFDKDAQLIKIIPEIGFGFEEVGSVTGKKCLGNQGKRLWRLNKSKSLAVYYGLKNEGAEKVVRRIAQNRIDRPLGVNLAKTNDQETISEEAGIADYLKVYLECLEKKVGDYFTINISCPNTFGGEPFTEPEKLDHLLKAFRESSPSDQTPLFLKLPAEMPFPIVDKIIELARKYKIAGFVCTNLAKNRNNHHLKEPAPNVGGMSGKVVSELSDKLIKYIYQRTGKEFVIIGCGGIFSAEDAYQKIRNGASLLELITGMIFEGPQLISEIKIGLVKLLKKDGFKNISEAVGANVK